MPVGRIMPFPGYATLVFLRITGKRIAINMLWSMFVKGMRTHEPHMNKQSMPLYIYASLTISGAG